MSRQAQTKVCLVCGDRALALNFGAASCETCKAFFRRNARKLQELRCVFQGHCLVNRTTRKRCAACRLQKCLEVGMMPELILDDNAKKARLEKMQAKREEQVKTSKRKDATPGPLLTQPHFHPQQQPFPQQWQLQQQQQQQNSDMAPQLLELSAPSSSSSPPDANGLRSARQGSLDAVPSDTASLAANEQLGPCPTAQAGSAADGRLGPASSLSASSPCSTSSSSAAVTAAGSPAEPLCMSPASIPRQDWTLALGTPCSDASTASLRTPSSHPASSSSSSSSFMDHFSPEVFLASPPPSSVLVDVSGGPMTPPGGEFPPLTLGEARAWPEGYDDLLLDGFAVEESLYAVSSGLHNNSNKSHNPGQFSPDLDRGTGGNRDDQAATAPPRDPCAMSFIDDFLLQSLEGYSPSSRDFHLPVPVAVHHWASEAAAASEASALTVSPSQIAANISSLSHPSPLEAPLPPLPLSYGKATPHPSGLSVVVAAEAHGLPTSCQATPCGRCDGCQLATRLGRVAFEHVRKEELPSDMKRYWLLGAEERALLVHLSSSYQDTLMRLTERDPGAPVRYGDEDGPMPMEAYIQMLDTVLHLCVRFGKTVPEFRQLEQTDQIAALKASSLPCFGIVAAAAFLPEQEEWVSVVGQFGKQHYPPSLHSREFVQEVADYCGLLKSVAKNDLSVYALLHCLLLFDPRESSIQNRQVMNSFRDKYLLLLKHHLESEYSYLHADRYFSELVDLVVRVRYLGQQSYKFYRVKGVHLKPLSAEMLLAQDPE